MIMNKANKITLPTIGSASDRLQPKLKRKFFKGWIMNDTFSNWNRQKKKNHSPSNAPEMIVQSIHKGHSSSKSQLSTGMTLGDYFRTRAHTEHSKTEENYEIPEEDITPYLRENFQIHETDEDNYEESDTSIKIPQKQSMKERDQIQNENYYPIKMKTQSNEQSPVIHALQLMKKKTLMSNKSKQKMQHMSHLQQSFDLKIKNKNRALSNEIAKKYKANENNKKNGILERVKADKVRVNQLKSINVDLIVKYANKFNLDDLSYVEAMKSIQ